MNVILTIIAKIIIKIAEMGAGFLSMGIGYQPEIPEELLNLDSRKHDDDPSTQSAWNH